MNIDGYALVTGAGSGIGLACAQMYAEEGAAGVAFADINLEAAEKAAQESVAMARNPDYRAISVQVDIVQEMDAENMVQKACGDFGRIDYAVNCAGISISARRLFGELTLADFDAVLNVNCKGTFNCLRAEVNAMKEQEPIRVSARDPARGVTRGTIINMGSLASYASIPGGSAYSTSKHAALGLTKNAAFDCAKHDIRINCLCPAFVETSMVQRLCEANPGAREYIEGRSPMKRMAQPAEIADVAMFLSSPRSSYVTGAGWVVGGGAGLEG